MKLTGGATFLESLRHEGVDVIFGYPGGVVLSIYDEIYRANFNHVLVRHEQGGIHMAEGYARASGKVGVVLVTSGPGGTNTVTGLVNAMMDSTPVVVFTGQVSTHLIGNDAFQEADIVGISRPCTKHNYLVKNVKDLPRIVREAFYIASHGRPGPVLVDIPKDVILATEEFHWPEKVSLRGYNPVVEGHVGQIQKALRLLEKAERPMVYFGGGVILSDAAPDLTAFVRRFDLPVTGTLMGLGGFPASDPRWLGMLGMHGMYWSNMAVQHSDLLIAVGSRFDDRVTGKLSEFAPHATIVHIDIDPTSISKNVKVDVPIVGDVKRVLAKMLTLPVDPAVDWSQKHRGWWDQISTWRATYPLTYTGSDSVIKPQLLMEKVYEHSGGRAIVTGDVGQHQMWAAQYYQFNEPRHWITSGGLGAMGFGFPAAIGAQVARPEALVVAIVGDGSFEMTAQEMATAVKYNLPVKVVIMNNGYLGMVRQWQELFFERRYSHVDLAGDVDFVKLADAYGATGLRATTPQELDAVLKEGLSTPGVVLLDIVVDREENVYPMVPAGASLSDMLLA